jgi:teichuronic acid biosynthesis glycosyltransferase TuaC
MKVAVVAEYYPRAADPVLGVWAHRQALAAREAGAEVQVLVLHRPLPSIASVKRLDLGALASAATQPHEDTLDGIRVDYVRFVSPPRGNSYARWGAWAARPLARALRTLRKEFAFDLVHAHYAVPAGDAVRRGGAADDVPLVVSVHGGDVLYTAPRSEEGRTAVHDTLANARLVLANSAWTEERCRELGARDTRVVHLGTDIPATGLERAAQPTLVTVAHLDPRKRHADVLRALAQLPDEVRYVVVGDGPERAALEALARELGVSDRVTFRGQLPPAEARAEAQRATLFVLPSVDEAFGVAYVEAMAGGTPAIASEGEGGPREIAAAGGGMTLVPPQDPQALAATIQRLLADPAELARLGGEARATVQRAFTWERCGAATVAAYEEALR